MKYYLQYTESFNLIFNNHLLLKMLLVIKQSAKCMVGKSTLLMLQQQGLFNYNLRQFSSDPKNQNNVEIVMEADGKIS